MSRRPETAIRPSAEQLQFRDRFRKARERRAGIIEKVIVLVVLYGMALIPWLIYLAKD